MRRSILLGLIMLAVGCFPPALPREVDSEPDLSEVADTVPDAVETDSVVPETDTETGPTVPHGVVATVDRYDDVEVTWQGVAAEYRVYRCNAVMDPQSPCMGGWHEVTTAPVTERRFRDTTASPPERPAAPTPSTTAEPSAVTISWPEVVAPTPPVYAYRVTAVDGQESPPSSVAKGHRAPRPITRYEVQVGEGEWDEVGLVTSWVDGGAAAPTLGVDAVEASQGTHASHVALVATGVTATPGVPSSYRVRAVTEYGPGPASEAVTGHRAAPTVVVQWQRSVDATEDTFEDLPSVMGSVAQDTSAPIDGSARFYRVVLSGAHAQTVTSPAVAGWRQPPPGVPGGLTASTELSDRVRLSWQAVSGALGYHVYRGEQKLTSGTGITATTFEDFDTSAPGVWLAPSGLSASTQQTDGVAVSWVPPSRPVGATASYSVTAVNTSGEGERSVSVSGRRSAPALDVWEVEVDSVEGTRVESVASLEQSWLDEDAPFAQIVPGSVTATQGDHRAFVRLSSAGVTVTSAAIASYRVRGRLVGGGATSWSESTEGRRAYGAVSYRWQRSPGTVAQSFTDLGSAQTFNDTTAPSDGAQRWYRTVMSAPGAEATITTEVAGWRLAFVELAVGHEFTCARTPLTPDGGRVWCWGANMRLIRFRGHRAYGVWWA